MMECFITERKDNLVSSRERVLWLDWIRGFSISIIVIGHVLLGLYATSPEPADPWGRFVILFLYAINVPLLFFVSGAVSHDEKKKPGDFWRHLGLWVVWPYFLWSFLLVFTQHFFSFAVNTVFSFDILRYCLYRPVSILWFLYAYALIKIAGYVAFSYLRKPNALISLFAISLSVFFYALYTKNHGILYSTSIGLFFFSIGKAYNLYRNHAFWALKEKPGWLENQTVFLPALIGLLVANFYNWHLPADRLFPLYVLQPSILLTGTCGIIVCSFLALQLVRLNLGGMMCRIGRHTMAIYLMHVFVVGGIRHFLLAFTSEMFFLNVVLLSCFGIALPMLGQVILDRMNLNVLLGIPKTINKRALKC